jgi:hypothetical protein
VIEGLHRQSIVTYSPQQNRVIERQNSMIMGASRSMLKGKGLPDWFGGGGGGSHRCLPSEQSLMHGDPRENSF